MKALCAFLLATTIPAFAQSTFTLKDAKALGQADTKLFYAGETSPIWDAMSPEMKQALKDPAGLQNAQHTIAEKFGKETAVLHESVIVLPPHIYAYTRIVQYQLSEQNFLVQWTFGEDGKSIEGFGIHLEPNPAPSKFEDYKDKTALALPVAGAWTVYQGGPLVGENYHAAQGNERFAYDLSIVKDGSLYSGDGIKNTDFYSFGQPVLAPAAGKVIAAEDQYTDNAPSKPSETDPNEGNSVIIDHGNGEFSMFGNLKAGSIKVKIGDTVKAGQQIAEVGQSGNSPIPHLNYRLQNSGIWQKGQGLPIQFTHLLVNGKPATVPVRGDIVETK